MRKLGIEIVSITNLFLASICILCTSYAFGQNHFDSIDVYINEYIEKNHVPGFSYCVVKEDKIDRYNSFGIANIEKDLPMTIQGIMNIASISKTITATAIMQLWENGLVDLYTDINDYLDFQINNSSFGTKSV